MDAAAKEKAKLERDRATARSYIHDRVRYVVKAEKPGERYIVEVAGDKYLVLARTCDAALTEYLGNARRNF